MAYAIAWPFFPCLQIIFSVKVLTEARRKLDSKTRFLDNKAIYHSKYKYMEVQKHETMYGFSQLTQKIKKIIGQIVLEGHIKHCVKDGIEHGDADKTIEDFTKAVERFANMSQKIISQHFQHIQRVQKFTIIDLEKLMFVDFFYFL